VFAHGSKSRLTEKDLGRFAGPTLLDRLGRAVCHAGVLPRKELYEAWEVARRARRLFRGGRVMDLAAGHGLLAHVMLLLDDSSPRAVAVDTVVPDSAHRLHEVLLDAWPRLRGRVALVEASLDDVSLHEDDVVVSSHACGALTDEILEHATTANARVAVLPCCHDLRTCDAGPLRGWLDPALAIDVRRAERVQRLGYRVWTQVIPGDITPKNRLILAALDQARDESRKAEVESRKSKGTRA
jgi:hypothetical protein